MSLTDFTNYARVIFDAICDKPRLSLKGELLAPPLTQNYGTVGTAFDYAMRLMLSDINKTPVSEFPLVAELAAKRKKRKQFIASFHDRRLAFRRHQLAIDELIPDCITLAKLESVFRSKQDFPDSLIFTVDEHDVADLKSLIKLVDASKFRASAQCLMNPIFNKSSADVGGADADFIIDSTIIDIKTTKHLIFEREYFRQLVGYYLLNKRENNLHGEITTLGIYFSRFAVLATFPAPLIPKTIYLSGEMVGTWDVLEDAIRQYNEPD